MGIRTYHFCFHYQLASSGLDDASGKRITYSCYLCLCGIMGFICLFSGFEWFLFMIYLNFQFKNIELLFLRCTPPSGCWKNNTTQLIVKRSYRLAFPSKLECFRRYLKGYLNWQFQGRMLDNFEIQKKLESSTKTCKGKGKGKSNSTRIKALIQTRTKMRVQIYKKVFKITFMAIVRETNTSNTKQLSIFLTRTKSCNKKKCMDLSSDFTFTSILKRWCKI